MKPIMILGIVLIVAGIAGLVLGNISWTETEPLVKAGPLEINTTETHNVWIPTAAAIAAVLAGLGLVFAGTRASAPQNQGRG
jgi:uncharacterized membrane protein YidH (DUF202 family)